MKDKKYELLKDDYKEVYGIKLYRIRALKDFGDVKKGHVGGYIEKEENLSQINNCWVDGEAKVYGKAEVWGKARVYGKAQVYGEAQVCGDAEVWGKARVYGKAQVYGEAQVCGDAEVWGKARVYGKAQVWEEAQVYGEAEIFGEAGIFGKARVCGETRVYGKAEVCGEAEIKSLQDYIVFKNNWSSGRSFTWTRSNDMWKVGCFYGTGKEIIEKAYKDSELSGDMYKMHVEFVEKIKERLKEE